MEDILLISKEILRKDYLSCYGGKNFPTPNIDRLAKQGTLFTNYYTAAPSTGMALTCMFSGLNAYEMDRKDYTEVKSFTQSPTLFSILQDKGYETHVIWAKYFENMAQRYSKIFASETKVHNLPGVATHILAVDKGRSVTEEPQNPSTIMKYYQETVKIMKNRKKPLFIWMHCPHVFNPRSCVGSDIDLFDNLVGQLMGVFDGNIYLTADHGGMIGEKNIYGYGFHVYEGVANIPLITPNHTGRKVINEPISSVQLKNIILDKKVYPQEFVYGDTQYYLQPNRKLMIRKGNYKYIYNKKSRSEELYDLQFDPNENVNLLRNLVREPDRKVNYHLNEVYYYPRWDAAEIAYQELKKEKDRIWRTGNKFIYTLLLMGERLAPSFIKKRFGWLVKLLYS